MRRKLAILYLVFILVFALLIQSFDWVQIEKGLASGPACPLRSWLGLQCAFCGMTHSWIALMKGDVALALKENVLGPMLLLLSIGFAVVIAIQPKVARWNRFVTLLVLAVLFSYAVIRNVV